MIDLNIANFITVGLISIAAWAAVMWAANMFNINIPFLTTN